MKTATHLQQEAAEVVALGGAITIYNSRSERADGAPQRCCGRDGVVRTAEIMPAFRQVLDIIQIYDTMIPVDEWRIGCAAIRKDRTSGR